MSALIPRRYRDDHLGDLREGFQRRAGDSALARHWYWRQVIRSIPAALRLRIQTRNDPSTQRTPSMESVVQDLRYGLRAIWKSPGFALVSTVTLALAIGVNTSIFSLVSVVIFADLPMQERETVALIRAVNPELDVELGRVSPADYLDLVERNRSFESLSALTETQWVLTGQDRPTRVQGLRVTAGITGTWHLPPVLGRSFLEGEDLPGAPHVAMLTHGYWQRKYGGHPDVLGETLRLDGVEYTVVGVMHPKLEFAEFSVAEVVVPLVLDRSESDRAGRYLFVSGRLAPGVPQEAATEEVRRIGEELAAEHPVENAGWRLRSAPVMDALIDRTDQTLLVLLQLTVGMVILIACANVANMLLARAIARAREIAVRHALGAGRSRLVRQFLTESLIISLASAALGLAVAKALNEAMIWISAGTSQAFLMAALDWRVLLFTLLVSLVAPLVFGLFPALRASAGDPSGVLRDGRSGDGGRAGKRFQAALVTAQVSLALTLMIVAVLLTRSVINLDKRPLGYDEEDLLTVLLDLPDDGYGEPEARRSFFTRAGEVVSVLPSLGQVELASSIPGVQQGRRRSFVVEGREVVEGMAPSVAMGIAVSQGLFDLLGLEIVRGRSFEPQDGPDSPPVTVISQELAHRYWPDEDPVGTRIQVAGDSTWLEIVGIVGDVRNASDSQRPALNLYLPYSQDSRRSMYLISRNGADPGDVGGAIREAVWSVDADQPVDAVRTAGQIQREVRASRTAVLILFVTFAVFALFMAAIGVYGVMAYAVSQRRNEIGLRMALGAEGGTVRWMVVAQGIRMVVLGMVIGLAAAFAMSRLLGNLVFGISTSDPVTFVGVPAVLAVVALTANLVPAVRATRLDPAKTLRAD